MGRMGLRCHRNKEDLSHFNLLYLRFRLATAFNFFLIFKIIIKFH